jgi:2-amino-4-hydroxy-6-hydroxymethyldihydropteridine diphosphokinase
MMTDAFIGLGSNMGDRVAHLAGALRALDELVGTRVSRVSEVYESEPWGVTEQPRFANAVAKVRTTLRADQLLHYLQDIEEELGRVRSSRYGPRTIDLDLLLFGDEEWSTDELTVPHPRLAEREFVVAPLLAIAPDARWPDGTPIERGRAREGRIVASLGVIPGFDELLGEWRSEEWVEVASAWGANLDVDIKLARLRDAGVPAELDQRPFADKIGLPLGGFEPSHILVPESFRDEARRVLEAPVVRTGGLERHQALPRRERATWFRLAMGLLLLAWAGPRIVETVVGLWRSLTGAMP